MGRRDLSGENVRQGRPSELEPSTEHCQHCDDTFSYRRGLGHDGTKTSHGKQHCTLQSGTSSHQGYSAGNIGGRLRDQNENDIDRGVDRCHGEWVDGTDGLDEFRFIDAGEILTGQLQEDIDANDDPRSL